MENQDIPKQLSDEVEEGADGGKDWQIMPSSGMPKAQSLTVAIDTAGALDWHDEDTEPSLPFPVVGIGASAGGLQAFRELLQGLPPDTGMAFVLITHLAADKPSHLSEILARHTKMRVQTIGEGTQPEPNQIHILAPGQIARLENGRFRLAQRNAGAMPNLPVDAFFRSLGSSQKSFSIGIVLSGADSDGALGLKTIKGEGGLSLAQSPETAQQAGMPLSSIEMDHVDFVGSPAELAVQLSHLAEQFNRPQIRSLELGSPVVGEDQSITRILQILRNTTGLDLRQYKPETIRRRIGRRMVVRRIETLTEYSRFLQLSLDEVRVLHEDALINVTRFFRDPDFWHTLSNDLLPLMLQNRTPEKALRIWCAGCATGEEPYSLAIAVLEYLSANGMDTAVQIFATDVSNDAIEFARAATYPDSLSAEISPERLRRYFIKVDRGYQVSKRVRDCCIFARQNLASDPPFSHVDLLSCRNVLIYFNQALQRQVISTFHYALEPEGFLLLGTSESLRDYGDYFKAFDRKNKVYSKTGNANDFHRLAQSFNINFMSSSLRGTEYFAMPSEGWPELELQRAADRIVLARYAPPGLIVDDQLRVLQARGQTAPYVELAPGAVSWNLGRILRDEIASEVKGAVERAIRENIPVAVTAAMLTEGRSAHTVRVDVLPITSSSSRTRCFLVLFAESSNALREWPVEQPSFPDFMEDGRDNVISQLRQDLTATRFHLQSLIEERDSRNQELVSANEEIQSANEELQSTNEELETTKEELQSANEELQTVNEELQLRNQILSQTGNDLTNLLNSVNIPLLMLTEDLKIRQFTPPMERLLNIRAADVGRYLKEIRLQLSLENIEPILIEVLDTLGTRELEVQDRDGRWNLLRVRPYRTAENKIEGLVVLLVDIDQLRSSQLDLRIARDFADSIVQSVPVPVVVLELDCSIRSTNNAFRELTQRKESELRGRSLPDLVNLLWGLKGLEAHLSKLSQAKPETLLEFEHRSSVGPKKTLLIKGQALAADEKRVLLLTLEDITVRRETEKIAELQQVRLQNEVESRTQTLLHAQEQSRSLAGHLLTAQEEERQHVARELHDDISQRLSRLAILCTAAEKGEKEALSQIKQEVKTLNDDVRSISHHLHPSILIDLGLPAALRALIEDFREREHMPASYSQGDVPEHLSAVAATTLYRITQEALRNVTKHAGKTHVKVSLERQGENLELTIRDSGTGFDQDSDYPQRGLGLVSMRERARIAGGKLTVSSSLGKGTVIVVSVPVEQHE